MTTPRIELLAAVSRLDDESATPATAVTSIRLPVALREAMAAAVAAGFDASSNELGVTAIRDRLELYAQRVALDMHYETHPDSRPTLAEIALALAELDGDPLAADPDLIAAAAEAVVRFKPTANADDVLMYAAGMINAVHR